MCEAISSEIKKMYFLRFVKLGYLKTFALCVLLVFALPELCIACGKPLLFILTGDTRPIASAYYAPLITNNTARPVFVTLMLASERRLEESSSRYKRSQYSVGEAYYSEVLLQIGESKVVDIAIKRRQYDAQIMLLVTSVDQDRLNYVALLSASDIGYSGYNIQPVTEILLSEEIFLNGPHDNPGIRMVSIE